MRRTLLFMIAIVLTIAATAQTLKITTSNGTTSYSAADVTSSSPATFANGTTMTIGSDTYTLSNITSMQVVSSSSSTVDANTVNIIYNGSSATVTMADNVATYVTAEVSGAHVSITQSNTAAIDGDEITYVLSGTTTNGSLTLAGSYKCTVSLDGVTLTNPSGAAINITNSKPVGSLCKIKPHIKNNCFHFTMDIRKVLDKKYYHILIMIDETTRGRHITTDKCLSAKTQRNMIYESVRIYEMIRCLKEIEIDYAHKDLREISVDF